MSIPVWQSWDNVLESIKDALGADVMKLELSDSKIINKLYNNVLPEFSGHSGLRKYYKCTTDHIISTEPIITYELKDFDFRVFGIDGKIDQATYTDYMYSMNQHLNISGDVTDHLIRQNYRDMAEMMRADDTYRFLAPNKIQLTKASFSYKTDEFILVLNCIHNDPTTIDPTLYQEFKNLSIAYIMNVIGRIRKKYNRFTTPFGEIELNADELIGESRELRERTLENLLQTPHDQLLWVL
jgi:hypothetical protein